MRYRKIFPVILTVLIGALCLAGCASGDLNGNLNEEASAFSRGKASDPVRAPRTADAVLADMIENFSGSREQPEATPATDEDVQNIRNDTDDDQVADNTLSAVGSDDDLKQVMHDMLDGTKEVADFSLENGYTFDGDTLKNIYNQLIYEDAYDAVLVESFQWGGSAGDTMLQLGYSYDTDTVKKIKADTRTLGKKHAAKISAAGKSDGEIAEAVNEYLCDLTAYPDADTSIGTSDGYKPEDHTAYGAFQDGRAVCDGYSKAAKILLNELGVECGIEVGSTEGGGHAWNLVKVDGSWYQMDVTWNDSSGDRGMFLLVTDAFMKQSRTWDESMYPHTPTRAYGG